MTLLEHLDAQGRMLTEGRRMFVAAVTRAGARDVGQRLHISKQTISALMGGRRRPSIGLAILIERTLAIPVEAWRIR